MRIQHLMRHTSLPFSNGRISSPRIAKQTRDQNLSFAQKIVLMTKQYHLIGTLKSKDIFCKIKLDKI